MRNKLATLPGVECRYGWSARTVEQDDDGVRVMVIEEGGPGREILEADYVVGCDGARSIVRDQTGIARGGTDFDQLMVLVVFRSRELHERLRRFPERSTYRVMHPDLKGYWQFFGRIDVGEGWFSTLRFPPTPRGTTSISAA
jgi:2-polyprenyl-6-methoxyphenol hydroxylase-like FAD-dependent oxidoreductase